ncbi:MAG: CHAT domain-containing protein [Blastocatellia bacterium]|nr:CHAT domain-containing protein [Blastocatellia bacterium]
MAQPTLSFVRRATLYILLLIAAFTCGKGESSAFRHQQETREPITLALGTSVEREIASGQTDVYQIRLEAGLLFEATVEQRGVNIAVKVTDDAGKLMFEEDRVFGIYEGAEPIFLIAETTGVYRLHVAPVEASDASGRYVIKAEEPRSATQADHLRARAEALFREGLLLSNRIRPTRDRSEAPKAVAKLEEALALWQALDNKLRAREVLCRIGAIYLPLDEILPAQTAYERALGLIESNEGFTAFDLNNLGFLYNRLGELQKALRYYQQALPLRRLNRDRWSEGVTLDNIGQVYRKQGELYLALECHLEALRIFRELKKRRSEAIALSNIANVKHKLGETDKAIEYARLSLDAAREVDDKRQMGIKLHNIGTYYLAWEKPREAMDYLNQALAVDRAAGNAFNEAHDLATLGRIHTALDEPYKALDFFDRAMSLHRKIGNRFGIAQTLIGLGLANDKIGDLPKAIAAYEEALTFYRLFGEPDSESETLNLLAGINRKQGNWAVARQQLEEAIELAESVRARAKSQQSRSSYLAKKQAIYDRYTDLLMDMHKLEPGRGYEVVALQNSERARARSLLELLAEARADIRQGADPALLAAEKSVRQQLSLKGQEQTRLFSQPANEAKAAALAEDIENLTAQLQHVEARIRVSSPRYAALTQPQPLTASQVQQLLDDDTVLLEFALGEKQSWLWAVTGTNISAHKLPSRREIEQASRRVYELLTARQPKKGESEARWQARIAEADRKLPQEAGALSRMLLGSISTNLDQEWRGKRLAIIASGALEYLPFGVLTLPGEESGSQPLIALHEIVNLPSASVLSVIRQEGAERQVATKTVAVLADPVFEADDPRVVLARKRKGAGPEMVIHTRSAGVNKSAVSDLARAMRSMGKSGDRGGLSRLPFSREEADAIASLVPADLLLKATDFQASHAKAVSGELSDYRIVHFATHGLLNSEHPELSGLVLSLIDENGKSQDGFLRMHEIYNLRIPAEVVVLSACQTGLGKEFRGEGLVGLTRGFMYAGAQRVVASLWQVDDLATAELMKRFYRGMLRDGMRPAAALRAAQIELMKEKRWSSPYFWAAFVMQGEWK